MTQAKFNQQGVALIQVLLISAIITILGIRFSYSARDQVEMASAFELRVKATQALKSAQNKIIYALLTEKNYLQAQRLFPDSEAWNSYGKPFLLNPTTKVSIQDNNGLLSLRLMGDPLWQKLLQKIGFTLEQAQQKIGELKDWQDSDQDSWIVGETEPANLSNGQKYRNNPIQLAQEIDWFFEQAPPQQLSIVKQLSSHYPRGTFNPHNAPNLLLQLLFDESLAQQMINQRDENELSNQQIRDALGAYDNERIGFFNSLELKITIQVIIDEVQLQETMEIKLQPRNRHPVSIFARY